MVNLKKNTVDFSYNFYLLAYTNTNLWFTTVLKAKAASSF